jgi:adenylate cyclase
MVLRFRPRYRDSVSVMSDGSDLAGAAVGGRKLIAVVYADMVGYSRLIGLDDAGTSHRLRTLRETLIDPAIYGHGGRVVQTGGDSLLIAFDSLDGAVRCAVTVQRQMPIHDGDQPPDRRIRFRIGINIGDVIVDGTNLHGDGVNIAARLEAASPVGGICVSRTVRDHVHGRLDLAFKPIGPLALKNIARPVEAFVLRLDPGAGEPLADARQAWPGSRSLAAVFAGTAGLLRRLASGAGWRLYQDADTAKKATRLSPGPAPTMTQDHTPADLGLSKVPRLSIVVLPFQNLSGDPGEDYLADGITEDLTSDLSHLPQTFVIAHASARRYKERGVDPKQIGRELGVRYMLEGSTRRIGPALRVNAQLIDTGTGAHVWSDRFDQDLTERAEGEGTIVRRIALGLDIALVQDESARGMQDRPDSGDAFDFVLRAKSLMQQQANLDRFDKAQVLYDHALRLDPQSVPALTGLAHVLTAQFLDRGYWLSGDEPERLAKLIADAQTIAPADETVLARAAVWLEIDGRYIEAMALSRRIIEIYPNYTYGYTFLARSKIYCGDAEEAIPLLEKAIRLDPYNFSLFDRYWRLGFAHLLIRQEREALAWFNRALAAIPDAPARQRAAQLRHIAAAHALIGEIDEARRALAESDRVWPFSTLRSLGHENYQSSVYAEQFRHFQHGLRLAGLRDHADECADFRVEHVDGLSAPLKGFTPLTVPGARTIGTAELGTFLEHHAPVVIDTMGHFWGRSLPGAIGLIGSGVGGGFTDRAHERLAQKMPELMGADLTTPIITVGFNSETFDGCNLARRLVALGYTDVYWYRGGREAWEAAGLPEAELVPREW